MPHPKLKEALDAIEDLVSDTSVSLQETQAALEEVASVIEMHLDGIESDLSKED